MAAVEKKCYLSTSPTSPDPAVLCHMAPSRATIRSSIHCIGATTNKERFLGIEVHFQCSVSLSQTHGHMKNFYKWVSDPEAVPFIQFTQKILIDCPLRTSHGHSCKEKDQERTGHYYFSGKKYRAMKTHCTISLSEDNCFQGQVVRNKRASQASAGRHWLPPGQWKYLASTAPTQAGSQHAPPDHTEVLRVPGTWGIEWKPGYAPGWQKVTTLQAMSTVPTALSSSLSFAFIRFGEEFGKLWVMGSNSNHLGREKEGTASPVLNRKEAHCQPFAWELEWTLVRQSSILGAHPATAE